VFFIIAIFLHLFFLYSPITSYVDHKLFDTITPSIHEREIASTVVIDIDEKSLDTIGQWPWPRLIMAQLIRNIVKAKVSNLGIDILFPESDRTSPKQLRKFYSDYLDVNISIEGIPDVFYDNDRLLSQALASTRSTLPVYLGDRGACELNLQESAFEKAKTSYNALGMLCNVDILHQSVSSFGFINAAADSDGIFRRLSLFINYNNTNVPSFALANLLNIDHEIHFKDANTFSLLSHSATMDDKAEVLLQFYDNYSTLSAVDVLQGNFTSDQLQGKIVLIGTSAVGLKDSYLISDGRILSGVNIHATFIDNFLNDSLIVAPQRYKMIGVLASFIFSIVIFWLLMEGRVLGLLVSFLLTTGASLLVYYIMAQYGVYSSLGYFLTPYLSLFFIITLFFFIKIDHEEKAFVKELSRSNSATLDSMVLVAEMRDLETGAHIIRTKHYIKLLAEYLYERKLYPRDITPYKIDLMFQTAPLHDVGKVGIPDSILLKNAKLSSDEFEIMKTHTEIGRKILANAIDSYRCNDFLQMAQNIAAYHHEKFDGSGYPYGLKGSEIPLEARLMALADVYDALISRRVYKNPIEIERAEAMIIYGSGTHFDPQIIKAFMVLKDEFRAIAEKFQDS
jgi:adenylate cyclase